MDDLLTLVVFLILLGLGAFILTLSMSLSEEKTSGSQPIKGTNFFPSQMYPAQDGLGGIAVNHETCVLCLMNTAHQSPRLVQHTLLVSSYLVKNGAIIDQGQRTGPQSLLNFYADMQPKVESLIKSWQAASFTKHNQRIDLLLLIHDTEDPLQVVHFLDMETKEGGILYEKAFGKAKLWHNILNGLILQANQLAHHQEKPEEVGPPSPPSVADEIEKLGYLLERKLITPQEFVAQKEKLLAPKS